MQVVLPDQARGVSFVDRGLKPLPLADELPANVDVAGVRPHGERSEQAALDEQVRIVPDDLAVLAGAGLRFIGVDHQVMRAAVRLFRHEGPFQPRREPRAAAPAQAARLDLVDDPVLPLLDKALGAVPRAPLTRSLKPPVVLSIQVLEDAIFIGQHGSALVLRRKRCRAADGSRKLARGSAAPASCCDPFASRRAAL